MSSHYLNEHWNIVNWTLENTLQWNFNWNSSIFILENAFENVVCEMASILSWPQCVKNVFSSTISCVYLFSIKCKADKFWVPSQIVIFPSWNVCFCRQHILNLSMLLTPEHLHVGWWIELKCITETKLWLLCFNTFRPRGNWQHFITFYGYWDAFFPGQFNISICNYWLILNVICWGRGRGFNS